MPPSGSSSAKRPIVIPSPEALECHHCGYPLRGIQSDACPECGTPKRRSVFAPRWSAANLISREAELLSDLRVATLGTLILWGGLTYLPIVGQVGWVALAIVALWRLIVLDRLSRLSLEGDPRVSPVQGTLLRVAFAEAIVSGIGAALTFLASLVPADPATVVVLAVLRIVWVSLDGLATFEIARFAASIVRQHDPRALPFWWAGAWLATLVAPVTLSVVFGASIISVIAGGSMPQWVLTGLTLVALLGCVAGVAGVIACRRGLGIAAQMRIADSLVRDEAPTMPRAPRQRPAPVREPGVPSDLGDVIPFADDDP